ncbi:hydroxymethylglutaryl-CoA lyase [Temperatibacter marinus]|uniref:Hydroxymethylglutaryl-CoA lyase n=1 Tax=Temperatibacter marinus TaxID=1456591 RepID=A0AA52EK33_9PROT|nr:hydroxymethylglutaryl-CoA lyase [Temperatibacter marinus]WND03476.1 hydroxymethylglutaryl-CoA lyase [Temperatibacter marinus]
MTDTVEIVEVGARDGLQNEKVHFSTDQKITLIERAIEAGVKRLEVASFVHPKLVPQMADAEAVIKGLPDSKDITYIGLALNKRGALRGLATRENGARGIDEIGCVAIASDTFATKNQGQTSAESVQVSKEMIKLCKTEGMSAQVTISAAWGCPFEGRVDQAKVIAMAEELAEAGPREIAIADTIGVGSPKRVYEMMNNLKERLPEMPLRAHFHNTRNTGLANAWAAYSAGVRTLDSSVAGLGGCPFAPKATGNIGTEDLLYLLEESDVKTAVDLEKMIDLAGWVEEIIGRTPPAMVSQAGGFPNRK